MTTVKTQSWRRMRFADFVDTAPKSTLEKSREYPFIPMELIDGASKYPTSSYKKKFSGGGSRFMNGDTVFARITPCLENGKIAQIKNLPGEVGFGSTEFFVFRNKEGVSDKDFIYYLSRTEEVRSPAIKSMVGASGRQRADKSVVENLEVLVPSISKQQDIAGILSKYDDLIENNTRRIQILEQMAQAIYTEWFVNFRFPDHEKVKMVDSGADFGEIPQGWKVATLSDLVENVRNATPSGEILKERNYVPIDLIDSQSLTLRKYNSWTEAKSSLILFEKGDILFGAMRPYFHKVAIAPFSGVTRGTCLVLRPKYDLVYCALTMFQKETIDFATANSQGATIPYINWNVLAKKKCLIPSNDAMSSYSKYIQPLLELNQRMAQEHEKLIKSRDLFLPKLVTGEIRV